VTCIVGIAKDGVVYLGGDSALSSEEGCVIIPKRSKVFRSGEIVLGSAGSVRVSQLMEWAELPEVIEPIERYVVKDLIGALKKALKDDDQKEGDLMDGSAFLVGLRGRLFAIYSNFQVAEASAGYYAVGAAEEIARGSLHSTQSLDFSPATRLTMALEAAYAHNATIRPPFTFVSTDTHCREGIRGII
jgi:ATP-dependent protease HslVU (ClpYQ) peptidase subunit